VISAVRGSSSTTSNLAVTPPIPSRKVSGSGFLEFAEPGREGGNFV